MDNPDDASRKGKNEETSADYVSFQEKRNGPIEGMEALQQYDSDHNNLPESERQMKEEELSFYSASENDHGDDNIWGLLSGVGGNIFEW